jgi:hypothetical protein
VSRTITALGLALLLLNVLLSFAQFEREVTGERIRDKIAASKRKGIWMRVEPFRCFDRYKLCALNSDPQFCRSNAGVWLIVILSAGEIASGPKPPAIGPAIGIWLNMVTVMPVPGASSDDQLPMTGPSVMP